MAGKHMRDCKRPSRALCCTPLCFVPVPCTRCCHRRFAYTASHPRTSQEAHLQLDYAIKERGVNFVDTAELYPVPVTDPRWRAGTTEE